MRNEISQDWKNYTTAIFFIVMTIGTLIFIINYAFTDWEEVGNEINKGVENMADIVDCEIKYKDFYYNGICSNPEEIFDFLKGQYNTTNKHQQI